MKSDLKMIRILSDGRPGHENQSAGLAEALRRRTGAAVEVVRFPAAAGWWTRLRLACAPTEGREAPQVLIAAGHRTHVPLWLAARKFKARSVVIMRPSLPLGCFDLCLVPRHDLRQPKDRANLVTTRGALNRIAEEPASKTNAGLILIGGPSAHHGWDAAPLLAALPEIVGARPELEWTLSDSRRTPVGFLDEVRALGLALAVRPHQETPSGWVPAQLATAREAWVTEDSASMVFEAITARARTGVLPLPKKAAQSRVAKAMRDATAEGYAMTLQAWRERGRGELPVGPVLHETARCAEAVLARFYGGGGAGRSQP